MGRTMVSAAPSFAARTCLVGETIARLSRPDRTWLGAIPQGRDRILLLVSLGSSLLMMLMVAAAGVGIARTSDAGCLAEDAAPCVTEPAEWCRSLNREMLCPGELT